MQVKWPLKIKIFHKPWSKISHMFTFSKLITQRTGHLLLFHWEERKPQVLKIFIPSPMTWTSKSLSLYSAYFPNSWFFLFFSKVWNIWKYLKSLGNSKTICPPPSINNLQYSHIFFPNFGRNNTSQLQLRIQMSLRMILFLFLSQIRVEHFPEIEDYYF